MTRVWRPKELMTGVGAQKNVAMVRQYWWSRGYLKVDAWTVPLGHDKSGKAIYGVRSNLVNGKPA